MKKFGAKMSKKLSYLKSSKGKPLRFDFAVYDKNWKKFLLIEYDGEAHFQKIKHFYKTNTKYLNAQGRDRKKNDYCLARGIQLYRIPYWEIDNITNVCMLFSNKFLVRSRYHNDKLIPK